MFINDTILALAFILAIAMTGLAIAMIVFAIKYWFDDDQEEDGYYLFFENEEELDRCLKILNAKKVTK